MPMTRHMPDPASQPPEAGDCGPRMTTTGGRGNGYELTVDREDFEANGLHARLYTRDPGGCWAVYAYDMAPYLVSTHPSEVDALRAAVSYGAGAQVVWLPWGQSLTDALKQAETSADA